MTSPEEAAAPAPAPPPVAPSEIDIARFDPDAVKVVARLHQHGHQAYFVGGCVRDNLLSLKPKDFDIATSAHPSEVRGIFRNCRLIGRRFRLAHVFFKGGKIVEVSTFRANPGELVERDAYKNEEGPPANGSIENGAEEPAEEDAEADADLLITHDNVFGTAEEDARRRDFTVNGLFFDISTGQVIDYVGGKRDLAERFIRTIGDAERRMREDPVRILRAVRFASKLGFDIESRTYAAMEGAVEDLPRCAPPRLLEETFRLIRVGSCSSSFRLLAALDALKILIPPVAEFFAQRGPEGEKLFYAFTEALDRRVQSGPPLDDAVLLAAVLLPLSLQAPVEEAPGGRPQVAKELEALLTNLVRNARLPRRIGERCRLILSAQRTLSGQRRRRGSPLQFRRHPLFGEALSVFEIWVAATGEHQEFLEKWKEGGAPEPRPDAAVTVPRKRRRRKRGSPRPHQ